MLNFTRKLNAFTVYNSRADARKLPLFAAIFKMANRFTAVVCSHIQNGQSFFSNFWIKCEKANSNSGCGPALRYTFYVVVDLELE